MNNSKIILIVALVLLAGNIFLGVKYISLAKELRQTQASLENQNINEHVLSFTKLFIQEVLQAETEVSFETRLQLENTVRNLDDAEVLAQWTQFIESKTQEEAQDNVKNLLEMLVSKIKVQ